MKKVGLSVCYDTKNFGSQLQVLATIKKIEELGYSTEIIQYKKILTPKFIMQTIPRLFNPYFLKTKMSRNDIKRKMKKFPDVLKQIDKRNNRFNSFIDKNFKNLSNEYCGWETLCKEAARNYDAFLCGSDQLWLPSNLGSHFYTLEFAPYNKPKIAYATSFGVSNIPWFQRKSTERYLKKFDSISTREISGSHIIKNLTGRKAKVVCDPTLLLTSREWYEVIEDKKIIDEKYIFCYYLGTNSEHRAIAEELKMKTGFKIVTSPFLDNYVREDIFFGDIRLYDIDSCDFVNLIRNAEFVLTDSFHGSIFSILNHKKFITFNRFSNNSINSRNTRIDTLCSMLCLDNRRYNKKNIYNQIIAEIDYSKVDELLNDIRNDSISFLKGSLHNIK